jgi:hypothetical protein
LVNQRSRRAGISACWVRCGSSEQQDGGGHTGIGAEDAGRQLDDPIELLVFDQHAADLLVRRRRAEEHTVRDDDRRAATRLEQLQEQRHEQQFGLLRLDDPLQVLGGRLVVEGPGKRRVGQDRVDPSPPSVRKNGNTSSATVLYITAGSSFLNRDHRRSC